MLEGVDVFHLDSHSVYHGDVREALRLLPDASISEAITSPPYYGLRAYAIESKIVLKPTTPPHIVARFILGCDELNLHGNPYEANPEFWWVTDRWVYEASSIPDDLRYEDDGETRIDAFESIGLPPGVWGGSSQPCDHDWEIRSPGEWYLPFAKQLVQRPEGLYCTKCNAWKGCLGMEPDWVQFVHNIVEVFREVRRVLHPRGILFLNLGDSYVNKGAKRASAAEKAKNKRRAEEKGYPTDAFSGNASQDRACEIKGPGLKERDLAGIPWKVFQALQEDGWFLRADCIHSKDNPQPAPPRRRPTHSHEYYAMLALHPDYFYDDENVRQPHATAEKRNTRIKYDGKSEKTSTFMPPHPGGRALWTVMRFPVDTFSEAHFAVMSSKCVEICVRAGASEGGICQTCGEPYRRLTQTTEEYQARLGKGFHDHKNDPTLGQRGTPAAFYGKRIDTVGWQPLAKFCKCAPCAVPAVVLDPFSGSGTVGEVALRNGHHYIGIEQNPDYVPMTFKRCARGLKQWKQRAIDAKSGLAVEDSLPSLPSTEPEPS